MNTKTPPNTAAIKNLKSQGFKIDIIHYRRKAVNDKKEPLIADKTIRAVKKIFPDINHNIVSQTGGATEIRLSKGEDVIVVRADCYVKDNFNRRIGVKTCLDRLEKLHNIKA